MRRRKLHAKLGVKGSPHPLRNDPTLNRHSVLKKWHTLVNTEMLQQGGVDEAPTANVTATGESVGDCTTERAAQNKT